ELAGREIAEDLAFGIYGPADAELTVVGWGSTKGAILDAIDRLSEDGKRVNFIQIRLMRPFPVAAVTGQLKKAKRLVLVENNYSGQLGQVIRAETGVDISDRILKYDGRPFSEEDVVRGLKSILGGQRGTQRIATEGPQGMDVDMPAVLS